MNMLFGEKKIKILVNYILQVLLLPAAAPNPTGAGCPLLFTGRWILLPGSFS